MSDMIDMYRGMKVMDQERRADRREDALEHLKLHKINGTVNNGGAHLIIKHGDSVIDFWPGTDKFMVRGGKRQYGINTLCKFLGIPEINSPKV